VSTVGATALKCLRKANKQNKTLIKTKIRGQVRGPLMLSMGPCKWKKSNEEKSKHVSLAQQNDFGPAFFVLF
jgi:hypothetical protein